MDRFTLTAAVALEMPLALAVMVADPDPVEVTGTDVPAALAAKATLDGTVATPELLELTFTIRPPDGAGAFKVSVRFWVPGALKVKLAGENDIVVGPLPEPLPEPPADTCTVWFTVGQPKTSALMVTEPPVIPVMVAVLGAARAPSMMMKAPG